MARHVQQDGTPGAQLWGTMIHPSKRLVFGSIGSGFLELEFCPFAASSIKVKVDSPCKVNVISYSWSKLIHQACIPRIAA